MKIMRTCNPVLLAALLACATLAQAQADPIAFRVNGRDFMLPADTQVLVNDEPGVLADVVHLRDGMQVQWTAATGPAPGGAGPALVFSYTLIGPVTSVSPLAVLGQPVTITSDTVLAFTGDPSTLAVGQQLVVAGLVDANGSLWATLIEKRPAPGNKFLLSGYVQQLGAQAGRMRVGALWVDAPAVVFQDCAGGQPAVGDYLELRATAVDPFPPGGMLTTVFDGRCVAPVPPGTTGAVGFLQGLVSAVPAAGVFAIGALEVSWDTETAFVFGGADDLAEGVAVVVDGAYTATNAFAADNVEFVRPVVRFEGPVQPADVVPGVSVRVFGVTVHHSAQVRDEDGILANGLAQPRQVEVRGYLDGDGVAHATRVRERGAPDLADTELRGPVQAIADPVLTVQGLVVDTSTALFFDHDGVAMDRAQFFAALEPDDIVGVAPAVYDPVTQMFDAVEVTLIGVEPVPPPPGRAPLADTLTRGTANGYALPEVVFADGFE